MEKGEKENEKLAEQYELELYNLARKLIEEAAKIKVKNMGGTMTEPTEDEQTNIGKELKEIKELLAKGEKRVTVQWVYSLGFAGMIGSVALIDRNIWAAVGVFLAGLLLMLLAPCIKK